ncbi:MAG: hypothetical protein LBD60_01060 [Puniceicoccales bacterium]|jgi:hypothetical protein|nr:hypothetical protein [Puniceicoccales bacterium]
MEENAWLSYINPVNVFCKTTGEVVFFIYYLRGSNIIISIMDMSPLLDAMERAAYIVAKHEKLGDKGHIGKFNGKIKQEINQMAAEKFKRTLTNGTHGAIDLIENATNLLREKK